MSWQRRSSTTAAPLPFAAILFCFRLHFAGGRRTRAAGRTLVQGQPAHPLLWRRRQPGLPEMIAQWYRDAGYHFLALSDHNLLSEARSGYLIEEIAKRSGHERARPCRRQFGSNWRQRDGRG